MLLILFLNNPIVRKSRTFLKIKDFFFHPELRRGFVNDVINIKMQKQNNIMEVWNLLMKKKNKEEMEGLGTKWKSFKAGLNSAIKFFQKLAERFEKIYVLFTWKEEEKSLIFAAVLLIFLLTTFLVPIRYMFLAWGLRKFYHYKKKTERKFSHNFHIC